MNTRPPERDLHPDTRARQRDELIAIVEHESAITSAARGWLVPLAAAAAVVAVVAGLAFAVPALRSGRDHPSASHSALDPMAIEPLSDADRKRYGEVCLDQKLRWPPNKPKPENVEVLDGFRFVNAPSDAYTPIWVIVQGGFDGWSACGINAGGELLQSISNGRNHPLYHAVATQMIGAGSYDSSVARITIAIIGQPPVEAVMRNGFYFAPVKYVRIRGPHTDATPLPYQVRGYDAAGELVYSSPANDGAWHAKKTACYIDSKGILFSWSTDNPNPDRKTCQRVFYWNYLPR
jgi:hypothetical protein